MNIEINFRKIRPVRTLYLIGLAVAVFFVSGSYLSAAIALLAIVDIEDEIGKGG